MIRSMTAFARQEQQGDWGALTCEIRTVNHRYLEPIFRLPDSLRELETPFRDLLRQRLGRGKVEVGMRLQLNDPGQQRIEVNAALAETLNHAANQINRILDNPAHINALDILRWPGVMQAPEQDLDPVKQAAELLFRQTVATLLEAREREGERLRPLFDDRLAAMVELAGRVRARMPELLERQAQTLRDRFAAARVELEPDRLAQEMVMLAQKADVAEELDRLDTHIAEVRNTLAQSEPIGRRLDFLMQELNREANTLSSKSIDAEVTRIAVDLKVLIEQMREQVQNLE
ncbi:MAG: YicC family protein [Marinobacter sp.]|nr:YicC family protein [Marinobacter sp.]